MANFVTARPVVWADGVAVNANDLRAGRAALLTPGATALSVRGGVLPGPGNPGLISALGTPAMKVTVKAASYEIPSASATGGSYTLVVDQDADLDITASDGSNPRTDLVIAEVVDNGDATTTYQVRVLTGTAGPGAPRPTNTTPNAHWITIGSVDVRALAESSGFIRAQDVHDERLFTAARGGIVPVKDQTEMDALPKWVGLHADRADTGKLYRCDGTAWSPVDRLLTRVVADNAVLQTPINSTNIAAKVDATNLLATFTVPQSGKVLVEMDAGMANVGVPAGVIGTYWTLVTAADAVVSGALVAMLDSQVDNRYMRGHYSQVISGLTPGASLTWYWGFFRGAGGTGTTYLYYGGDRGQATMTISVAD